MFRALIRVYVFVVAAVALAPGCGSERCDRDDDCDFGQFCQAGTCANYCESDGDCPTGRYCADGYCVAPTRCADATDCVAGTVCEGGFCRRQEAECRLDSECPPNFRCCEGGCYSPGEALSACLSPCVEDRECSEGQACLDGRCRDVSTDAGQVSDAAVSDASPDAGEDTPATDTPATDTAAVDTPATDTPAADSPAVDTPISPPDVTPDPEPDVDLCEGRADGQLGERCTGADDCCNGLCFGNADAGRGVCTEICDSFRDCNPLGAGGAALFCYREPTLEAPLCALSDYGASCFGAGDCVDGRCLVQTSSRQCTYRCATTGDCPSGEACGLVNFDVGGTETPEWVCTPIGASPCRVASDCLSGTCLSDDESGVSYCSTICHVADPGACPSPFVCTELPDGAGGTLPVCLLPGA